MSADALTWFKVPREWCPERNGYMHLAQFTLQTKPHHHFAGKMVHKVSAGTW